MSTFKKEDLPPLPEGACLSSSSPPPALPALLPMSFDPPNPFQRMASPSSMYNMSWVQAIHTIPLPPTTVMSLVINTGGQAMFHPQPHLIPTTFGTILPFHTAPISKQEAAPPITEPLPPNQPNTPVSSTGTNPSSKSGSPHQTSN